MTFNHQRDEEEEQAEIRKSNQPNRQKTKSVYLRSQVEKSVKSLKDKEFRWIKMRIEKSSLDLFLLPVLLR